MGASMVLKQLLAVSATGAPTLDSETHISLLQMGVVERLSQLMHPMLEQQDSTGTKKRGESSEQQLFPSLF